MAVTASMRNYWRRGQRESLMQATGSMTVMPSRPGALRLLYSRAVRGDRPLSDLLTQIRSSRRLKVFALSVMAPAVACDRWGASWLPHFDAARM
jgi:hypothetical protein